MGDNNFKCRLAAFEDLHSAYTLLVFRNRTPVKVGSSRLGCVGSIPLFVSGKHSWKRGCRDDSSNITSTFLYFGRAIAGAVWSLGCNNVVIEWFVCSPDVGTNQM